MGSPEGPAARAARRFDTACRLIHSVGRRTFAGDEEIGRRLAELPGAPAESRSRDAIRRWRRGETPVPAWALLGAEELAGIEVTLRLPGDGASRRDEANERYASMAAVSAAQGGNHRPVRLQVWLGGLGAVLALLVAMLVGATGSLDPGTLWSAAGRALQHSTQAPGGRAAAATSRVPVVAAPAPVADSIVGAQPTVEPGPGVLPALPVAPGQHPAAIVELAGGSAAGPTPSPGVRMTSDPRGAGGMTGTVREGPVSAGGTIDGAGARGCLSLQPTSQLCGSINVPGQPLPVPPLPAPSIPAVLP